MTRPKPRKPPPSVKPWPCTVLAIDTATQSGWALSYSGRTLRSGEVNISKRDDLVAVCRDALEGPHAVLVLERAWGGPRNNVATLLALGAAKHAWETAWLDAGGMKSRIVRVYPATWRARVLGGRYAFAKREAVQRAEQHMASHIAGAVEVSRGDVAVESLRITPLGPNQAAALCIGKWASHAGEVGKVLPARIRKAFA